MSVIYYMVSQECKKGKLFSVRMFIIMHSVRSLIAGYKWRGVYMCPLSYRGCIMSFQTEWQIYLVMKLYGVGTGILHNQANLLFRFLG